MSRTRLTYQNLPDAEFDTSPAYSILVSAERSGVRLRHDCGGKALCGTCRVKVVSGSVSPMSERERLRLAALGAEEGTRLACQARAGSNLHVQALFSPDAASGDTSQREH